MVRSAGKNWQAACLLEYLQQFNVRPRVSLRAVIVVPAPIILPRPLQNTLDAAMRALLHPCAA